MLHMTARAERRALEILTDGSFAVQMGLYINLITDFNSTELDDLVEPEGAWYNRQGMTWSEPFTNALGKGQENADSFTWVTDEAEPDVTIFGVFWIDNEENLHILDPFDSPITLVSAVMAIEYQPVLTATEDVAAEE